MTNEHSSVEVVPASDPAVLHLVQHLRYVTLVGEQGLEPPGADHVRRLVVDDLDRAGASFAAFAGPHLVGSVRVNLLADGGARAYAEAYGLAALGPGYEARTALVTRLISRGAGGSADGGRNGALSKLVAAVLSVVAERGARWIAIGVETQLIGFYESMGFARFADSVRSPSGAARTVLVFDVEDPRHAARTTLAGWLYPALFARRS